MKQGNNVKVYPSSPPISKKYNFKHLNDRKGLGVTWER